MNERKRNGALKEALRWQIEDDMKRGVPDERAVNAKAEVTALLSDFRLWSVM